jgi:hypothetical protein
MQRTLIGAVALMAALMLGSRGALRAQTPAADPADVGTITDIVRVSYEVISGPAGTPRQWRRDSTLYMPGATFVATAERDGHARARILTPEEYRQGANAPFVTEGLFEYEIGSHIERFGNVAQVRSVYETRHALDGPLTGRGVNYFQLYWDGTRWWITGMVWDQERPNNPIAEGWVGRPDGGSERK